MMLDQQVTTDRSRDDVRRDVAAWFGRQGYRNDGGPLRFRRGSLLGSLFGLSPKKWGVKAQVVLSMAKSGVRAEARWNVDTSGQIVTETEEQFWHMETEDFVDAVHGRLDEAADSDRYEDEARAFSKKVIGWIVTIPLLSLVVVAVIAVIVAVVDR